MSFKNKLTSTQVEDILRHGTLKIGGQPISFADSFGKITIEGYEIEFISLLGQYSKVSRIVSFLQCVFIGALQISNYNYFSDLTFNNCVFEDDVSLTQIEIPLTFTGICHFKKDLHLIATGKRDFTITDITIEKDFIIEGIFLGLLTLTNINTSKRSKGLFSICNAKIEKLIAKEIHFSGINFKDNTKFEQEAEFKKIFCEVLVINHVTIGNVLRLIDVEVDKLTLDNLKTNHRYFELSGSKIKEMSLALHMLDYTDIQKCNFGNIRMWGECIEKAILNIEKSVIQKLSFDKIYNRGLITLKEFEVSSDTILDIKSSTLGKTDFINCDFSNATLEFENSKISDVFLSETDFPRKVKTNNLINWNQAQLVFGQLHTAFQKQGDTVRAIEYQAREIEAHYKQLKLISRKGINLTKVSLWLNKCSNNFGRNWGRGLVFSFAIGFLFFYFLIISTEQYKFGFPIAFSWDFTAPYLRFMNPLRFFDTESLFRSLNSKTEIVLTNWSYLFDFLGRVFVAYGFYQTIQAFRRYGRKQT